MRLSAEVWQRIRAHAEQCFPDECCGVLLGSPAGELEVRRVRNVQDEMHAADPERYPRTARTAYAGEPGELLAAIEASERPGWSLAAFYHSHPDHPSYFSDEDVRQATPFGEPSYPQAAQLVVSVLAGKTDDVKAFVWDAARESYVEEAVEVSAAESKT